MSDRYASDELVIETQAQCDALGLPLKVRRNELDQLELVDDGLCAEGEEPLLIATVLSQGDMLITFENTKWCWTPDRLLILTIIVKRLENKRFKPIQGIGYGGDG